MLRIRTTILCISRASLVLSVFAIATTAAQAGAPTVQIQTAVEKALSILRDPKLQSETKKKGIARRDLSKIRLSGNGAEIARQPLAKAQSSRTAGVRARFYRAD